MDPTLKNKVISKLKSELTEYTPRMKVAAKYILDHPGDFGLDQVRDSARKCGVSTNTFIRLAKISGFDSFEAMREPFRFALVATPHQEETGWTRELRQSGFLGEIQAEAAKNALAIVHRSLERQTPEQLERVVRSLLEARNVYLTAVRASYSIAHNFQYVGRMILPSLNLIPRHMNGTLDELNFADEHDVMVAITFNPYSLETVEACKFAKSKGVKLILISDSDVISPEFVADETLVVSVISTHYFCCYAGATALVETLLAMLVRLGGDDALRRIKSYEDLRKKNKTYWTSNKTTVFP
ncbi:MurR/RpiR family transcriptional regulator [Ruegeria sp.]|uniref:MurR/RpiR family transcriptional regulator n=1 Tax=Ruegeria sp. TaxID=1879320 RepID=UPI003AFFA476